MKDNFYHMKRQAAIIVTDTVKYLEAHPSKNITIAKLAIQFQEQFGFGETILRKMLAPWIKENRITIKNEALCHPR